MTDTENLIDRLNKIITNLFTEAPSSEHLDEWNLIGRGISDSIAEIEQLQDWIKVAGGIKCPQCDDTGGYYSGHGEVCQCQFCYECPDSKFNWGKARAEKDASKKDEPPFRG